MRSIGERIRKDILAYERPAYGEEIVDRLSRQLSEDYGPGFGRSNRFHMMRLAETFPDARIVHALSEQLSWTHLGITSELDRVHLVRKSPLDELLRNYVVRRL